MKHSDKRLSRGLIMRLHMVPVFPSRIPFFTVVTTTFNRAALLPRALDSLMRQSEQDWEGIVVDDGSNDHTSQIVREFIEADGRFRYLYHKNRGVALSRNAGLLAASGLFVTFLDSDDEYHPDHLELRRDVLTANRDIDILHGGVQIIGNEFVPDKNDTSKLISVKDCAVGGTFVIRTDVARDLAGFRNLAYSDDSDFLERALEKGYSIGQTDAPTYVYYRDTPDSMCSQLSAESGRRNR